MAMRKPKESTRKPAHGGARRAAASKPRAAVLSKVCIAVGKSQLAVSDTAAAALSAWKQLLNKLGGARPHLLICGYNGYHDAELLLSTLRGLCGDGCSIIGTSSGGGMVVDGAFVVGPCVAVMGIVDPDGGYDVCFAAPGEGAEERVRASIAAANSSTVGAAASSASASADCGAPPFSICLSTILFTASHADALLAGAEAALGKGCSLFGGALLAFNENDAAGGSPVSAFSPVSSSISNVAASRVFASARAGSDGTPPSMHLGQGVVLALCRPSVNAASAFTSATTPMTCRGTITKIVEGPSPFPGAAPITCIAEIDGRRALDVYAQWVGENGWSDEFDEIVAKARAQSEADGCPPGTMNFATRESGGALFGSMHGIGLHVTKPTCSAARGSECEDFKQFNITGWGAEGEARSLPGITPTVGQTVTIMDCPGGMDGSRAHTAAEACKLLHDQAFEVEDIRGAFSFCCAVNLVLEGPEGCQVLAEKLGHVLGGAPLLGFVGGPELGRLPNGGSEFGTFMYGTVVWSDRVGGA